MSASGPVITIGEVLAAFVSSVERPLDASTHFELLFAGAESTVAIGLARLGVPSALIGRVGNDALGRAALRHLRGEDVDVSNMVTDHTHGTGLLVRNASATQQVEVVYARTGSAGSKLSPSDVPREVVTSARALHLTGITPMLSASARLAAQVAADFAVEAEIPISFDPNYRFRLGSIDTARRAMGPFLRMADLVLTSREEALMLANCDDDGEAERWLLDQGARVVVVKDGSNGASATDGDSRWFQPIVPVPVVDPIGAGDAFNAGFLSVYRDTADIETALRRGAQLGAASVQTSGDSAGLPFNAAGTFPSPGSVLR